MFAGEPINIDRGPRGAAHGLACAAARRSAARSDEVAAGARRDARLRRNGARHAGQRHPPHRQHRHRRQRPRAADGRAGARCLRAPGPEVALRLQRRRPRHHAGAAQAEPRARRCSSSPARPSRRRRRWPTRWPRRPGSTANGGTDIAKHFVATTTNVEGRGRLRHHHDLRLLGLGRRALLAVVGDRPADRAGHRRRQLPRAAGRRARDGPTLRRRAGREEPAAAARPARRLVPQLPRLHEPQRRAVPPGPEAPAGLSAAARDGKQRQARRPRRRAAALRHQPGRVGRARHQRPARLLPDAAPGHRRDPGRVHPRQAPDARPLGPARPAARTAERQHTCCSPTAWRSRRR